MLQSQFQHCVDNCDELECSKCLSSRLLNSGFSCFGLFATPGLNPSAITGTKPLCDSFIERYGMLGDSIRSDLVGLCHNDNAGFSKMMTRGTPNLWFMSENGCDDINAVFHVPKKYGFERYSSILTLPDIGRHSRQTFLAFSSQNVGKSSVQEAIETINLWIGKRNINGDNAFVRRTNINTVKLSNVSLSKTEIKCLMLLAQGKKIQEISEMLDISFKAVRYNLEKSRKRYGFSTVRQALIQATIDYNFFPN